MSLMQRIAAIGLLMLGMLLILVLGIFRWVSLAAGLLVFAVLEMVSSVLGGRRGRGERGFWGKLR